MAEKELQEKIMAYRVLENRLSGMLRQNELVVGKINEIQATIDTIAEVEKKSEDILVPLGGEAYALAKSVDGGKILVEVGAGVTLEKTPEEAKQTLEKRIEDLRKAGTDLQREISRTSQILQTLAPQIQKLSEEPKAG